MAYAYRMGRAGCWRPARVCLHGHQGASVLSKFVLTAGAANSPAITDPTVGQAFLAISFNTDSNNITYEFAADNVTEILAAHIHIASSPGQNGSVSIPLYQSPFVPLPGSTSTGVLAGSALLPATFVGPYLEVLPDYDNVNVSTVLTSFVQTGQAYAQVYNKAAQAASFKCMLVCTVDNVPCCAHDVC